ESEGVRVLYDRATGKRVLGDLGQVRGWGSALRISRDDSTLVVRKDLVERETRTWRLTPVRIADGEELPSVTLRASDHFIFAVSPDGKAVAVADGETLRGMSVRLYQTRSWSTVPGSRSFTRPDRPGSILEFSPDGRTLLVSASEDRELFLLDSRTGGCVHEFRLTASASGPVAFSPCGRLLALTHRGRDRLDTITVYELCTGQRRLEFAPRNQVTALTFAADSSLLASGHGSGTA